MNGKVHTSHLENGGSGRHSPFLSTPYQLISTTIKDSFSEKRNVQMQNRICNPFHRTYKSFHTMKVSDDDSHKDNKLAIPRGLKKKLKRPFEKMRRIFMLE